MLIRYSKPKSKAIVNAKPKLTNQQTLVPTISKARAALNHALKLTVSSRRGCRCSG